MATRISAFASRELRAVIETLPRLDRELRKEIRTRTKSAALDIWRQEVTEQATSPLDFGVLVKSARVRVSDQNVTLTAGSVGRPLSGGLSPKEHWFAVEYGAGEKRTTYTRRSVRGRTYQSTRIQNRGLPARNEKGRVLGPAADRSIKRVAALWMQTTARTMFDALEGKL